MQIRRPQIEEGLIAIDGLRLRLHGDCWLPERLARACGAALSVDPTSGETHLRHRVTPDGFYRGNQVIKQPELEDEE